MVPLVQDPAVAFTLDVYGHVTENKKRLRRQNYTEYFIVTKLSLCYSYSALYFSRDDYYNEIVGREIQKLGRYNVYFLKNYLSSESSSSSDFFFARRSIAS